MLAQQNLSQRYIWLVRKKAFHHRCKVGFAACIFLYHLASYWTTLLVRFLYKILCPHSLQRMTSVGFSCVLSSCATDRTLRCTVDIQQGAGAYRHSQVFVAGAIVELSSLPQSPQM